MGILDELFPEIAGTAPAELTGWLPELCC